MNKKAIGVVIGLVIATILVIGIAYALMQNNKSTETDTDTSGNSSQQDSNQDQTSDAEPAVTIVFTDSGFEKSEYTVKSGEVVEVKNNSSSDLQFSSNDHPTHTEETELNLSVLSPGQSATFTPTRVGEWGFHDHLNDQLTGVLIVE